MEPKIGVYICHCGANIAATVDVEQVTEFAKSLPSVAGSPRLQIRVFGPRTRTDKE